MRQTLLGLAMGLVLGVAATALFLSDRTRNTAPADSVPRRDADRVSATSPDPQENPSLVGRRLEAEEALVRRMEAIEAELRRLSELIRTPASPAKPGGFDWADQHAAETLRNLWSGKLAKAEETLPRAVGEAGGRPGPALESYLMDQRRAQEAFDHATDLDALKLLSEGEFKSFFKLP